MTHESQKNEFRILDLHLRAKPMSIESIEFPVFRKFSEYHNKNERDFNFTYNDVIFFKDWLF